MNMGERNFGQQEPQYFAEYSLWNDSAYTVFNAPPPSFIAFTRPVEDSVFLSPPSLENKANDEKVPPEPEPVPRSTSGFEKYMKRALKVVTREELIQDPTQYKKDAESEDSDPELGRAKFVRPPRPKWRTSQANGRGRRLNLMQKRLEQALAQPARIDRGASILQRMGWQGGALGRSGAGITEPIAPNATYSSSTAGFGLNTTDSAQDSQDSCESVQTNKQTKRTKTVVKQRTKKIIRNDFKVNVLLHLREFVRNDLQIELFFDPKLKNGDRKRIHQIVGNITGVEENNQLDTEEMLHLARDIARRCGYLLGTQSDGDPPNRQICVYKEAKDHMFVVTPDDLRNEPEKEPEEETNPFLKSITKHIKPDSENTVLDKIVDYFVEFAETDDYTEFRFLGPFTIEEVEVINKFFTMVSLREKCSECPLELRRVLNNGTFSAEEDVNGFVFVKKEPTVVIIEDDDEKNAVNGEKKTVP